MQLCKRHRDEEHKYEIVELQCYGCKLNIYCQCVAVAGFS